MAHIRKRSESWKKMEDEYVAELVNTKYVIREMDRHRALCPGEARKVFVANLYRSKVKIYEKYKHWCDCCDWKVNEVVVEKRR